MPSALGSSRKSTGAFACATSSSRLPKSSCSQQAVSLHGLHAAPPHTPADVCARDRDPKARPVTALTTGLMGTYRRINEAYYQHKREEERVQRKHGEMPGEHDDHEYNYRFRPGEVLADRYNTAEIIGKGAFGQVVRAEDVERGGEVAIKMIKSKRNYTMQARVEISVLKRLNMDDPGAQVPIVRLLNEFTWRKHTCLVFELLSYNIYELLKMTDFKGLSLNLVRKFAASMLSAVAFLHARGIAHGDIKPENVLLVDPKRAFTKLIDFGSAFLDHTESLESKSTAKQRQGHAQHGHTYVQSRYYRAPEVIMGLAHSKAMDIWSLGSVIVELHTGSPLFPGKNRLDQMARIVDVRGIPPPTMVAAGRASAAARSVIFEGSVDHWLVRDTESDATIDPLDPTSRPLQMIVPTKHRQGEPGHTGWHYHIFCSFVERMLEYSVEQRITAIMAQRDMFFSASSPSSARRTLVSSSTHRKTQLHTLSQC